MFYASNRFFELLTTSRYLRNNFQTPTPRTNNTKPVIIDARNVRNGFSVKLPIWNVIIGKSAPKIEPMNFTNPAIGATTPQSINVGTIIPSAGNTNRLIRPTMP